MKNLNLTDLEQNFLTALISELYAEKHFSDVDVNDISKKIKIPTKTLRGVQSSLVKKGIIEVIDNGEGYHIIYLVERYFYLHPEWSK